MRNRRIITTILSDDLSLGCYDPWDREGYDGIPGDIFSGHLALCHGKSPYLVGKAYVRTPPRITTAISSWYWVFNGISCYFSCLNSAKQYVQWSSCMV